MKIFLKTATVFVGVLLLGSILIVDDTDNKKVNYLPAASAQQAKNINLSGTGQQATEAFELQAGLAVFNLKHTGSSNFAVKLMDSSGNLVDLLVNEIGTFDGKKAVQIPAQGKYLLDISADGAWEISADQSIPESPKAVPRTFAGNGQQVSKFFSVGEGLARFELSHTGSSNFAVRLLDSSGNLHELLVNEIGQFDGSKAAQISTTGVYVLDIAADGAWEIKVTGEKPKEEDISKAKDNDDDETEGCFIATAAYGDANAPDIDVLREFRDEKILTNSTGKKMVGVYYEYSPEAAEFIKNRPVAKTIIKETLIKPTVSLLELTN